MESYEMVAGESFPYRAVAENDGSAVNLTGYKFYLTLKRSVNDTDGTAVVAINSTDNATQFGTGSISSGIVDVTLLPDDTAGITSRTVLLGEVGAKDSAGTVKLKEQFRLVVSAAVLQTMS